MNRIRKIGKSLLFLSTLIVFSQEKKDANISANWDSLAKKYNVPAWFQDGKIGVWMHWGIPSSIDENRPDDGSHYGRRMYGAVDGDQPARAKLNKELTVWHYKRYGAPKDFGYEKFVPDFKAEKWDPEGLVKFFKDCGANFIMPVATHHDNFDLYDSFFTWNSVDMGPKRDIIQEWKDAAYKYDLKFGVSTHLYWSPRFFRNARKYQKPNTPEWELFNMDYDDKKFSSQKSWNEHWYKRCWELIEKYDPDMFNNDSPYPSIKTGDGIGVKLFTDFLNRDLKENNGAQTTVLSFKNPKQNKAAFTYNLERGMFGEIQEHPWMWATDLSGSWFYRKGSKTKMTVPVLIGNAIDAISKNGIVMINVALRGDGTLPEAQANMLQDFGDWVKINKEGIYGTRPWKVNGEGPLKIITKRTGENLKKYSSKDIRFTTKDGDIYAFVLGEPTETILIKTFHKDGLLAKKIEDVELLGGTEKIEWKQTNDGLLINLSKKQCSNMALSFKIILN